MADPSLNIGPNIRARRKALGLRLEDLATKSGVSTTMLSEVERGAKNPTVKLAYQVARALNCTLTDLLDEQTTANPHILRASDRRTLVDPETRVERHVLSDEFVCRGIELLWYTVPPGQSTGEMSPNRPGVLENISVFSGCLTFTFNGDHVTLSAGDTVTHGPATTEYRNDGTEPCHYLIVIDSSRAAGDVIRSKDRWRNGKPGEKVVTTEPRAAARAAPRKLKHAARTDGRAS